MEICIVCKKELKGKQKEYFTCEKCTGFLKNKRATKRNKSNYNIMNGIELIAKERQEQIEKHNRSINSDAIHNDQQQLRVAANRLTQQGASTSGYPTNWNKDLWDKMRNKPYKERLIIAGALIAAEIDRLQKQ